MNIKNKEFLNNNFLHILSIIKNSSNKQKLINEIYTNFQLKH